MNRISVLCIACTLSSLHATLIPSFAQMAETAVSTLISGGLHFAFFRKQLHLEREQQTLDISDQERARVLAIEHRRSYCGHGVTLAISSLSGLIVNCGIAGITKEDFDLSDAYHGLLLPLLCGAGIAKGATWRIARLGDRGEAFERYCEEISYKAVAGGVLSTALGAAMCVSHISVFLQ